MLKMGSYYGEEVTGTITWDNVLVLCRSRIALKINFEFYVFAFIRFFFFGTVTLIRS